MNPYDPPTERPNNPDKGPGRSNLAAIGGAVAIFGPGLLFWFFGFVEALIAVAIVIVVMLAWGYRASLRK